MLNGRLGAARILAILLHFVVLAGCKSAQKVQETGHNADLVRGAVAGNAALVEQAILAGADPLISDERGRTPLHLASLSGSLEAVKLLLQPKSVVAERRARREGVAILNYLNNTGSANYAWVGVSLPDAIQGIMAENFDFRRLPPEASQKQADRLTGKRSEYSPALLSQIGARTSAAVIITGSYSLDTGNRQVKIHTIVYTPTDQRILTESDVAAPLDAKLFEALSQVGAEIVTRLKEYTSVEFAIRPKNAEQLLISDVSARDKSGLTALSLAASRGDEAIVAELIKAGADYQADLIDAINFGDERAAVSIILKAPDVDFRISGGRTPLIQAAFKGRLSAVRALLARKAKPDLRDLTGFSAQLYAAQEGHAEILRDLIAAGANVNLRTWDGFSSIEAARRKGRAEIVEMLGKAGAK